MLTAENYFSPEMNMKYMGASQFKAFMECEAAALAACKGEYIQEETISLLVGSYVDAHFEKSLDLFRAKKGLLVFTQKGELRSEFKQAEVIIQRIERDELFMKYMFGNIQVIRTGEISGIPFKIKMDSYHQKKAIVDLKIMRDFEPVWKNGLKLHFAEAWGYDLSGAIYQAVEGDSLPFILAAATKEKEPNIALLNIPQDRLDYCLGVVKENAPRFAAIKTGELEPKRCECCDYCKSTKVLTKIEVIQFQAA